MFYYSDSSMSDMLSMVNKNINQMSNMENGYLDKMSSISDSGLYGNGIEMIDSQIVAIKDGLVDFKNITAYNSQAVEETERRLKSDIDKIALPKDFNADDVGINVQTSTLTLSKNDGEKINTEASSNVEMEDNFDVETEKLQELVKELLSEKDLDEYLKSKQIDIENINEGEVNTSEADDIKETKDLNLVDTFNENADLDGKEFDEYEQTEEQMISDMNDSPTSKELELESNDEDELFKKFSRLEEGLLEEMIRGDNDDYKG